MDFHWSLCDIKSPEVSRTLLSILNNAVVWMVSTQPPTSKSSSPFNNPLVTVPKASIRIGIIVTSLFHSFFQFPRKVEVLILHFTFFQFNMRSARTAKSTILQVVFFLLIIFFVNYYFFLIRSGHLAEIRWSVCTSKSHRSLHVSFSRTGGGLCVYPLFVLSNLNFLHIPQSITLPTHSCLVLYSYCTNLLHLLIMLLMVSTLSPHNLYLLFYYVFYILGLIWLVLKALFCADIRRDSVSLLKFLFIATFTFCLLESFSHMFLLMLDLHWNLSDRKFPQRDFSVFRLFVV